MGKSELQAAPAIAAIGLLALGWWPPFPWLHEHAQWSDALLLLFLPASLAAAAASAAIRERWRSALPVAMSAVFYCAANAASVLFGTGLGEPRRIAGAALLGGYLLAARVAIDDAAFARLARVVAAVSIATGVLAVGGELAALLGRQTPLAGGFGDLLPGGYARMRATLFSPNLLASYAIFASGVVRSERARLPAPLRRLAMPCLAAAALLSFGRGALVFAAAWLAHRKPRWRAALAVASAVALLALNFVNLRVRLVPFAASVSPFDSDRLVLLRTSWATFTAHPLLGSGPGTSPGLLGGAHPFDAHCTPLQVAATLGLFGLAAFAAVVALAWRRGRLGAGSLDASIAISVVALLIDGLAQDADDFRHLWAGLGLLRCYRPRGNSANNTPLAATMAQTYLPSSARPAV